MIYAFNGKTLDNHVNKMLEYWDKIKYRYLHTITRVLKAYGIELGYKDADEFMEILIKLHDVGKASKLYQDYIDGKRKLNGFRHELVSAYYTYHILKKLKNNEKLAFVGALTVMLHHEPIIMGQIRNLKKRELSAEVVLDRLGSFDGMVDELKDWLKQKVGISIENVTNNDGSNKESKKERDEIIRFVFEMSVKSRHMPNSEKLRLIIGALLLPLVMCDYYGAKDREGEAPKFAKILEVERYV